MKELKEKDLDRYKKLEVAIYKGFGKAPPNRRKKMPPDEDPEKSVDRPVETGCDPTVAELARESQDKPPDLKEKEAQHSELRKRGLTGSSADLPPLDLDRDDGDKDSPGDHAPVLTQDASLPPVLTNPDGSLVMSDGKHVTTTISANGISRGFKYGPDGNVNEVIEPSGHWTTTDGRHWSNESGDKWEGTVEVSKDGKYDSLTSEGHTVRYPNGSEVRTDLDGKVTKTTAADGSVREYTYGTSPSGKPTIVEIKESAGKATARDQSVWDQITDSFQPSSADVPHVWKTTDGTYWWDEQGDTRSGFQVTQEGSLRSENYGRTTVERLDGRKELTAPDFSIRIEGPDGKIEKTIDANHKERKFEYDADGKLTKVSEEDGVTWSSKDGHEWTTEDGRLWRGTISVDSNGTYRYVQDGGKETVKYTNGSIHVRESDGHTVDTLPDGTTKEIRPAVDKEKLEHIAKEIFGRNREDGSVNSYLHADPDRLKLVRDLTDSERDALKGIYYQQYGRTLGHDCSFHTVEARQEFNSLFYQNGTADVQRAEKLMSAIEKSQADYSSFSYATDRPNANKYLREELGKMDPADIRSVDEYFRDVYGVSLHDEIMEHTPRTTAEMCEIYLKDRKSKQDWSRLDELRDREKERVDGVPDDQLTAADMRFLFNQNRSALDQDRDGFVDKDEIDRAMVNSDFKGEDAQFVAVLKENYKELEKLSDDELGAEDDGITKKDIARLTELAKNGEGNQSDRKLIRDINKALGGSGFQLVGSRNLWGDGAQADSIVPDAIDQRHVGDCWFLAPLASLAATAEGKKAIADMIEDNGDGTYTVTFPGDPGHPVTIDEPTQAELAHGAGHDRYGIWVNVLEKAYGKYYGKHSGAETKEPSDNIGADRDSGEEKDGLEILTGKSARKDVLSDTSKATTHEKLAAAMRDGRIVAAGIDYPDDGAEVTADAGLPTNHAFSITGYDPETQTVTVRNPWGRGEPKGTIGPDEEDDGTFTMSLDQFYRNFSSITYAEE